MSRLRRPSGALVVACVALFVALGGGAYAATQIAPGSITHADLASNSVWHADIGKGSVQTGNLSKDLQTALDKVRGVGVQSTGTTVIGPQGHQGATRLVLTQADAPGIGPTTPTTPPLSCSRRVTGRMSCSRPLWARLSPSPERNLRFRPAPERKLVV
jgi:hypothetical protein